MKYFQKSSLPLLVLGLGILLFVLGLTAIYSLTSYTESELIDNYTQQLPVSSAKPKSLVGSAGHKLNLQFTGSRSIGGVFSGEDVVLKFRESGSQTTLLEVKDFTALEWREELLPANRVSRQMVISVMTNLPANLQVGTQIEGELSGTISYPIEQDKLITEKTEAISRMFNLQVVSDEAMLKQVRQRPILVSLLSFPVSLILILIGFRAEFYGRKTRSELPK